MHINLLLVQADIYCMPFSKAFFDKVYRFGVIQHTSDPEQAFLRIAGLLKSGGKIATDIYWKSLREFFHVKFWFRPFTKNIPPQRLHAVVTRYVDVMWPIVRVARRTKLGQKAVSGFVADRSDYLGNIDDAILKEWACLDTFDWLSPRYDNPQTIRTYANGIAKPGSKT